VYISRLFIFKNVHFDGDACMGIGNDGVEENENTLLSRKWMGTGNAHYYVCIFA